MKSCCLIILISFFSSNVSAQTKNIDSLLYLLSIEKTDTSKINLLNSIAVELTNDNTAKAISYLNTSIDLATEKKHELGLIKSYTQLAIAHRVNGNNKESIDVSLKAIQLLKTIKTNYWKLKTLTGIYNNLGIIYDSEGDNESAIKIYKEGIGYAKQIKDSSQVARFYLNMALVYSNQSNLAESLKYNFIALSIYEKLNNSIGLGYLYNNIGSVYSTQGNREQAFVYFQKAFNYSKKINLYNMASLSSYNMGEEYYSQQKYNLALKYAIEAKELAQKENYKREISLAFLLIGKIHKEQGKLEEALVDELNSLKLIEEVAEKLEAYAPLATISSIYYDKKDFNKAIFYGEKALQASKAMQSPIAMQESSDALVKAYQKIGNFTKAFDMQSLYYISRDSVINERNQKELLNQEYKYTYDKRVLADSLKYLNDKKINDLKTETTLQGEKTKRIILIAFLLIVLIGGGILFNRFKITQKQKKMIELQSSKLEIAHNKLEEKTKEINDSILYSKDIQNVFLKSITDSKKYLRDSILIYKPKDIVSGDFYWYKEQGENLFVVVGDCTGHGVPGAIISVLAIQTLEKVIIQINEPNELHVLNSIIKQEFNVYYKQSSYVGIGLDYTIICLNAKEKKLYASGSGSTIILKDNCNEIITKKFDSINIGGSNPAIYEPNTEIYEFEQISSVFLYTDGIIDQRGFENGKKFGSNQLRNLIANLNTNDAAEATSIIKNTIDNWQGNEMQIDDMTLLGIQIENNFIHT